MAVIQDDEFDLLKLMEQSPDEMMFGGVQPVVSNVASVDDVKNLRYSFVCKFRYASIHGFGWYRA